MNDEDSVRVCEKCGDHKQLSEFRKFGRGWMKACKECVGDGKAAPSKATVRAAAPKLSVAVSPVKNGLLLAHGSRLLSIALLGPREHDGEFIRALCAGLLQDSLTEAGCKDLVELAAEEA